MSPSNSGGGLTPLAKLVMYTLLAVVGGFSLRTAVMRGWIPGIHYGVSSVPQASALPTQRDSSASANIQPVAFPSSAPSSVSSVPIRGEIWAWNAQMGLIYANGGPQTTTGSLMEKYGVNLHLERQDSTDQMRADLVKCATELKDGAQSCSTGANFVVIMGDGSGQFLANTNPVLAKLGPEYQLEAFGVVGRSNGEDAFMAPVELKKNPQAAKGLIVVGVVLDGDWNIAEKWAADNGIKNNPDVQTWDPDAINWVAAPDNDYLKAVEVYNANACDDRVVVKNGKPTGDKHHGCIGAVVTWTPGDVNAAHGRGGLVKIASSREYSAQMPATLIGIRKFNRDHSPQIQSLLAATFAAGDQIKAFPQALERAAEASVAIYCVNDKSCGADERSPKYWVKYYRGVTETDSQGTRVELGGSAVFNLADNLNFFGLQPGSNNNFKSTYTIFSHIAQQQYPDLFNEKHPIPSYKEAVNTSYVMQAQSVMESPSGEAEKEDFDAASASGDVVSHKSYYITFDTASDRIKPEGMQTLEQLKDSTAVAHSLFISVDGYTDSVGSHDVNADLSRRRAVAIKKYLQSVAERDFPERRFQRVAGHAEANPVAPNTTEEGRSKNRRVEITLSQ